MKMSPYLVKAAALACALVGVPVFGTIYYAADFDGTGASELGHTGSLSVSEQSAFPSSYSTQVLTAPSPVSGRPGTKALRFEVRRSDPDSSGGKRSELKLSNNNQTGTIWYAWSVYVPSNSLYDGTEEIFGQVHGDDTSRRPPFDMTRVSVSGVQKWQAHWRWTTASDPKGSGDNAYIANVALDQWNDFVVKITWSKTGAGSINIWLNDAAGTSPVLSRSNINIGYPDQSLNYWKYGIYKWPWSGTTTSSSYLPVVWFDEVRLGDGSETYATIKPKRGSGGGGGSTATLGAVADTYAFGGSTGTNYGTALVLGAKDDGTSSVSFDRVAFVKFDLSGLSFTPTTATLVLATDATTQAGTVTVNQCTTDSWTETGLTWTNKPATGSSIGTATTTAGVVADKSINVSSYVNSQYTSDSTKIVSFALTGNNAQLYLKSREAGAGNGPELVVGN